MRSQVASYIISLINCDFLQFAYIKKDMEIRLQYFTVGIPVRARLVANAFLSCLTWDFKSAEALIFKSVWVILHVKIQNWSKNEDRYALWSIQVLPVASTNPPRRFQKNNSNKSMNFTLKSDTFLFFLKGYFLSALVTFEHIHFQVRFAVACTVKTHCKFRYLHLFTSYCD